MRSSLLIGTGLMLLAAAMGLGVAVGSETIPAEAVWQVVRRRLGLGGAEASAAVDAIVWRLRMPRVLLAACVGGGLAVIGVAMQTLVRNPLAEPYILGISSGASAGASMFYLGFLPTALSKAITLPLAAFAGGLFSIVVVFLVAQSGRTLSVARLLLAGVAMAALMGAVTSFVTFASPDPNRIRAVLFWLLGSFSGASWEELVVPAVVTGAGLLALLGLVRPLDALLLGEEPAHNLGVPVEATKRILVVLAALVTGTLVASSGAIGFVGLIVPHAVRMLVGIRHGRLIPLSFLVGAAFLVLADLAARTVLPAQELPVGVLTAVCGVPFFLYLLRRHTYRFG